MLVIGSYLSPYVRKVLAVLHLKGIDYQIDPIVPFYGSDEFSKISPLRRIPVLVDDGLVISDSTVICEYLNEYAPSVDIFPKETVLRARARWLEEFADSRLGDVFIWHIYNQLVIRKYVWGQEPERNILEKALKEELPEVMDYLQQEIPSSGYLLGALSIADISVASFFRNLDFAGQPLDAKRWPRVSEYVSSVLALDIFSRLKGYEQICMKTPPLKQREVLKTAGAPISDITYGTVNPRIGPMSV